MKVLQLLPALDSGGVEQGTVDVARGLHEAGHQALVMSAGGRLVGALQDAGARHLSLDIGAKSPLTLRHVLSLSRLLAREQVDILHLRSRMPAWIGYLAWRLMPASERPRLVSTIHGFYSVSRYSAVMTRGERIICVSHAVRRYLQESYPEVDASRIVVIHRGVDREQFPHGFTPQPSWLQDWERAWPRWPGTRTLLLPGRITRLKGHHAFLDLIHDLRGGGDAVRGFIAGGEDPRRKRYANELREAIIRRDLTQHVHMLGHRDDLREIMSVSDLVLSLSSKPESFGRTTLEALSLGRPTLGFEHGGVGEILHELYPAGAVSSMQRKDLLARTRELLQAPPPVPAAHGFSRRAMVVQTLEVYQSLLGSPS